METPKFNFKKHQNFNKSWKTSIRLLVYFIVISVLIYLIFNTNKTSEGKEEHKSIEQIEIEDVQVE